MGASDTLFYRPTLRVNFLSFEGASVSKEHAQQIVRDAYDANPWYYLNGGQLRTATRKAEVTVSYIRTILDGSSYEFLLTFRGRISPSQLYAFENYRASFAESIRDKAPAGFWNADVEIHLSSSEPCTVFALDAQERMKNLMMKSIAANMRSEQ